MKMHHDLKKSMNWEDSINNKIFIHSKKKRLYRQKKNSNKMLYIIGNYIKFPIIKIINNCKNNNMKLYF